MVLAFLRIDNFAPSDRWKIVQIINPKKYTTIAGRFFSLTPQITIFSCKDQWRNFFYRFRMILALNINTIPTAIKFIKPQF